jgi:hypothetical protein
VAAIGDLKLGDWLALQKRTYMPAEDFRFETFAVTPPECDADQIPEAATAELGEFIGFAGRRCGLREQTGPAVSS